MKMNVNVVAEALKNCERDGDMIEIPQSVARGFMHVIVKADVLNMVDEMFPDRIFNCDRKNEFMKRLNRNSGQVWYYLKELEEEGVIKINYKEARYKSVIIGNKIANYLKENNITEVNIYTLASDLDITVSTIHACVNSIQELRTEDIHIPRYDDRGRRRYTVEWTSEQGKRNFVNSGTVTLY